MRVLFPERYNDASLLSHPQHFETILQAISRAAATKITVPFFLELAKHHFGIASNGSNRAGGVSAGRSLYWCSATVFFFLVLR
jgi:hypothetical protein